MRANHDRLLPPASSRLSLDVKTQVEQYGSFRRLPNETVQNVRNEHRPYRQAIPAAQQGTDGQLREGRCGPVEGAPLAPELDAATRFIPLWVKVSVAIALGLGIVGLETTIRPPLALPSFSARSVLTAAACGDSPSAAAGTAPPATPSALQATSRGSVTVVGARSRRASKVMADRFQEANQDVRVSVEESGTGGGFENFPVRASSILPTLPGRFNDAESQQCLIRLGTQYTGISGRLRHVRPSS